MWSSDDWETIMKGTIFVGTTFLVAFQRCVFSPSRPISFFILLLISWAFVQLFTRAWNDWKKATDVNLRSKTDRFAIDTFQVVQVVNENPWLAKSPRLTEREREKQRERAREQVGGRMTGGGGGWNVIDSSLKTLYVSREFRLRPRDLELFLQSSFTSTQTYSVTEWA